MATDFMAVLYGSNHRLALTMHAYHIKDPCAAPGLVGARRTCGGPHLKASLFIYLKREAPSRIPSLPVSLYVVLIIVVYVMPTKPPVPCGAGTAK